MFDSKHDLLITIANLEILIPANLLLVLDLARTKKEPAENNYIVEDHPGVLLLVKHELAVHRSELFRLDLNGFALESRMDRLN